ncbi:hypothetical protein FOB64_005552 [Candida albicans]|uniref:Uncharacterized protein n=1 Tax=Candida albicans TaxID=5476 RepID=A0A8H6F128_CANAX|nr:hypothetical protein FOB64_005552 [Candida albicans]
MGTLIDDTNGLTNTPILASKNNVAKFQPSLNENEPTTTTTTTTISRESTIDKVNVPEENTSLIISQEDLYSTIDDDGDNDNESNSLTADTEDHNKLNSKSDSYTSYIEHELDLPQFERTIFQHHDIQINVPDSKHSLEATETDMEISEILQLPKSYFAYPTTTTSEFKHTNITTTTTNLPDPEVVAAAATAAKSEEKEENTIPPPSPPQQQQQLIPSSGATEQKVNPVSQALKMNTSIKKLKLATSNNIDGATPLIINSPTVNEIKLPTNNSWVLQDYEQLFGTKKFHKEIELAKSLRFADTTNSVCSDLKHEKLIYISTRIINPGKILSFYLKHPPLPPPPSSSTTTTTTTTNTKRDLYIDLIMNNNGCNILLQLIKYIHENETLVESSIDSVHVRISAFYVHQIKVFLNLITEVMKIYQKIKTLGLFVRIHQYENGYVLGAPQEGKVKLPQKLEKLYLANELKLDEFFHLPASIKALGLHNTNLSSLSKFNLCKNLESLHISGETINQTNRLETFPKGFYLLKNIKFEASTIVNFNFEKFIHLTSLSLSNIDFAQSRQLEFPLGLKKLEFIDCSISSHISAFPDSLRVLVITRGKWSTKRNANISRLQKLIVYEVQIKDLTEKINSCFGLFHLEVINCNLNNVETLKFPKIYKLKTLRIAHNDLTDEFDISSQPVHDVNLEGNNNLTLVLLHDKTKILNVSNTNIQHIIGNGLTKLVLNGCNNNNNNNNNKIDWKSFKLSQFVTQLSLQNCQLETFEFESNQEGIELKHLKVLDLSKNKLHSINLVEYENLEDVELSNNELKKLSNDNFPLNIKSINAEKNQIQNLNTLILNGNIFNEINDANFKLSENLRHLELNKCKISKFNLTLNEKLMSCSLNGNKLHTKNFHIKFIQSPSPSSSSSPSPSLVEVSTSGLKFLDLGSNFFKTFDFNMIKGIELSEINLANNMFDEIPESIPDNILSAIMFKVD